MGEADIEGAPSRLASFHGRHAGSWPLVATYGWLMAMSFFQRPGSTTFDTKFDLTADPAAFLGRSLSLWNPDASFGELQNQAYGYLFPQGPFFWLGDLAGLPDWTVQRLWSGLLLIAAFEGARRLVHAMMPGCGSWAAWLGGAAYAAAPRLLGLVGVLSGEVLQTAVLPWIVLPVVLAQQGRLSARTAAAASGVAMLFLGGVNAVGNLAALPVVVLVLLSGVRAPGGAALLRWWTAAAALACAWWLLPLLVLGRYSPPFLDYIETSSAVVRPLGWTNVTRGADHWLAFFDVGGEPWWTGAYEIATAPLLIAVTALVAGLGLFGLTRSSMPWRGALVGSLVLGAICLTVSRDGPLASPLHGSFQGLLDDQLAMLRNVHKVDPLLRLPLALGLAHAVSRWGAARAPRRVAITPVVHALVAVLLLVSAQPLWTGQLRKPGWEEVPDAWGQAADYLADVDGTGSALILPGSGFGQQTWGVTIDEPLQGLATTPWVSRSQVPLTPGTTIRLLDAIQERVADGRGSPALAAMLARAGVEYVVVRRDLDLGATGATDSGRVDLALSRSPGLTKVAGFGATGFGDQAMIDILEVEQDVERVQAVAVSQVPTLAGGSEDVLSALEAEALDPSTPVVVAGETNWPTGSPDLVGDGYRKRERGFGALDVTGPVMAQDEPYRYRRAAHDYAGPESTTPVYADYGDVVSTVIASSSAAYSDSFGDARPDSAPYNALDGLESTYWQSAPLLEPVGQWLEVRFHEPVSYPHLTISTRPLDSGGVALRRVRVTAGDNDLVVPVDPDTGLAAVALDGTYDRVRVTVDATRDTGPTTSGVVTISEIAFPGLDVDRYLVLPAEAGADSTFVLRSRAHRRLCIDAGIGSNCWSVTGSRFSDEESGIARKVSLSEAGTWDLSGTVVARTTAAAQRLLEPLSGVRARASSTYLDEPGVAPQLAVDDDTGTFWAAARGDESPTLRIGWGVPVTIDSLTVASAPDSMAEPTTATIRARGEVRRIDLSTGTATFPALTTRSMRVRFDQPAGVTAPVGVAEISSPALTDLKEPIERDTATGAICGLGPEVVVDGAVHPTRVTGQLGQVIDGTALGLELCGDQLALTSGSHSISVEATAQFAPTLLRLAPADPTADPAADPAVVSTSDTAVGVDSAPSGREVGGTSFAGSRRAVDVGAGPATLLVVNENFNDGWQATFEGTSLDAVRVDGWKQGFLVPAGDPGRVSLTFTPDRWYRAALGVGGLAALLLVVGLWFGWRRARRRPVPPPTPLRPARSWPRPALLAGGVVLAVLGGAAVLLGLCVGVVARRLRVDPGAAGAVLVAVAGVAAGVSAAVSPGLPPVYCDVLAGTGIGCVVVAAVTRTRAARRRDDSTEDDDARTA